MFLSNPQKKADLSLNMIIVAVIALVVLVVILVIFSGKISLFGKGVASCTDKGGICLPGDQIGLGHRCPQGYATISGTDCSKQGEMVLCCLALE
ncbi:hypothetical protein ACFL0W_05165 [Nanoarchaeota archaeon]